MLDRGTVVLVDLDPTLGHEQRGLKKASYALVDQVRSIDKRRVRRRFGRLPADERLKIDEGLRLYLGL